MKFLNLLNDILFTYIKPTVTCDYQKNVYKLIKTVRACMRDNRRYDS